MNNSQKLGSLRKARCDKAMLDRISIAHSSFKSICNGQEYISKLKGLPKIQRSARNTYACVRKIFVNGVMKNSESIPNTMKTRYQYHKAFTLQEEADEQEWTRLHYTIAQKFEKRNIFLKKLTRSK